MLQSTVKLENFSSSDFQFIGNGVNVLIPGHSIGDDGVSVEMPESTRTAKLALLAAQAPYIAATLVETVEDEALLMDETVVAGGSITTEPVRIDDIEGFFGLFIDIAGDGTAKVEYEISPSQDPDDFSAPDTEDAGLLMEDKTAGKYQKQIHPDYAGYLRFVVTETGTAAPITINSLTLNRR